MNLNIIKLMDNREFCEKLIKAESEAEAKELFKQYGIDIIPEDFDSVKQLLSSLESELKKLSIDQLQAISGGRKSRRAKGGADKKDDDKGTGWNDAINVVKSLVEIFKGPFESIGNFCSSESAKNRDADLKKVQIVQDSITQRHSQTMNVISGSAAALALTGAVAGVVYAGRKTIKGWWNKL